MAAVAEHLEVSPTLDEARGLTGDHNLIPVTHSFIEDCETPVSAFLKLRGDGPAFLLESAEQGQQVGRYSFIGWRPKRVIRWNLADGGDPYTLAHEAVSEVRQAEIAGLPPFAGGAVGFFGFDCVRAVERLPEPNPDVLGLPDMALMLSDVIVAFDHLRHTVTILANAYLDDDTDLETAHARAVEAIRAGSNPHGRPAARARDASGAAGAAVRVQHAARAVRGQRRADRRVHPRRRRLPGGPVAALERADAGRAVQHLPRPARGEPVAVHVLPRLRGLPDRRRQPGAAADGQRPPRQHPSDRGHAAARRGRRGDRRRAARGREGARRARDAGRPRPQRPRARVRARLACTSSG